MPVIVAIQLWHPRNVIITLVCDIIITLRLWVTGNIYTTKDNIPLFSLASVWQPNDGKADILYVKGSPFWNAIPDVPNPQAQYTGPDVISLYAEWTGINAAIMRYIINNMGFHHTVHKHYIGIKGHWRKSWTLQSIYSQAIRLLK